MRIFSVGAKAQSRLNRNILIEHGHTFPYIFDRLGGIEPPWECKVISTDVDFDEYSKLCEGFVIGIGGHNGRDRVAYAERLERNGLEPISAIHSTACIGKHCRIGKGLLAMAGAIVSDSVEIGDYCILNTACSIDHDCRIGKGVHIMGAAAIAGDVSVGDFASIGTNATVLPDIKIGSGAYIGAGAVVTKDVRENAVMVGVPARPLVKWQ
jgi:sugar O-acyltransferase (sialic acid O-acetyltransferase NeuD family)